MTSKTGALSRHREPVIGNFDMQFSSKQQSPPLSRALLKHIDLKPGTARALLPDLLEAIRLNLGMEAGFISRFHGSERTFEYVSDDGEHRFFQAGDSGPLAESYCARVVSGEIPRLIEDAQQCPGVQDLAATRALGIGAHISVPIYLDTGEIFGTLCCFSTQPDHSLTQRDVDFLSVLADLTSAFVQYERAHAADLEQKREQIDLLIHSGGIQPVWQPIVDLGTEQVVGLESLSRFNGQPGRGPKEWFDMAVEVDRHIDLERNAMIKGIEILPRLAAPRYLSVNLSGKALLDPMILGFLARQPLERLVVEVTEHDVIESYRAISEALAPLREQGLRLAVDDFGAGYASFRHVLKLAPDIIKLDMSLVREIDSRPNRRAVVRAMHAFAEDAAVRLIAEGIETPLELETLRQCGVRYGQGFLLHKPQAEPSASILHHN